ncbi:IclR family transcriptional regulator [uncultured Microbacterium sp.]|uniref:Glycerol operon regulatory protein n=1 Tax=uncultured Microbacterium sp. TaxID=191216 RepID=A0A1Y5P4K0_9MICO|nr:IclR family transcriptional regulator [uncultured Microbacterium sp.]SBS73624.1 IclR family transcriptional regulator [uncultured Microbacterium sp.]
MSQLLTEPGSVEEPEFIPVKSADRTLDVLEALSNGASSLAELAQRLHIPKSSLHSILRTLEHRGWVEADAARSTYSLGMNALLIGASYVDQDRTVLRTSDTMDRLAADTGETIHLARLELPDVVYLAKRESVHPLRMFSAIGRRLPAHATALGKAALAELPDDAIRALLPETLPGTTPHTITSREDLIAHLAEVRETGFAIDAEEAGIGMRCFAVTLPFQTPSKDAISCSVPLARLDAEKERSIIALLLEARDQLSRQVGSRRPVI